MFYMIQRTKVSMNVNTRIEEYGIPYNNASDFLKWFTRKPPFNVVIKKLIKEEFRAGKSLDDVGTEVIRSIALWSASTASTHDPMIERIRAACTDIIERESRLANGLFDVSTLKKMV